MTSPILERMIEAALAAANQLGCIAALLLAAVHEIGELAHEGDEWQSRRRAKWPVKSAIDP